MSKCDFIGLAGDLAGDNSQAIQGDETKRICEVCKSYPCFCDIVKGCCQHYLGDRFKTVKLSSIIPQNERQANLLNKLKADYKKSYYLSGDFGCGKTHFLAGVYKQCLWKAPYNTKFFTALKLAEDLKEAEFKNDIEFVFEGLRDTKFSFFDDMDKIKVSEYALQNLFSFFDFYYRNKKHMFITSNLSILDFGKKFGASLARRIEETCEVVSF